MTTYPQCKFYLEGGKCSHKDAPNPYHSWCIGKFECGDWDDEREQQSPVSKTMPDVKHAL